MQDAEMETVANQDHGGDAPNSWGVPWGPPPDPPQAPAGSGAQEGLCPSPRGMAG